MSGDGGCVISPADRESLPRLAGPHGPHGPRVPRRT